MRSCHVFQELRWRFLSRLSDSCGPWLRVAWEETPRFGSQASWTPDLNPLLLHALHQRSGVDTVYSVSELISSYN